MKKNIAIIVLLAITIFLAVYARIQTSEVERHKAEAIANLVLAEEHRKHAEAAMSEAESAAAEAVVQQRRAEVARQEAERLLAECKKK